MKLFDYAEMFELIVKVSSSIEDRSDMINLRKKSLTDTVVNYNQNYDEKVASLFKNSITKVAFDTRRVNQYTDYNPRRNLQYYHRSEPFITKDHSDKIKVFFKLKIAADAIKEDFIGDPDWHDSYCRILCSALDRTLRVDQKDMDFFKPQFDYLDELLYLRYRLKDEDIQKLNEKELRNLILDKDEKLLHKQIYANYNNGGLNKNSTPQQQLIKGPDSLVDKLFGDIKASKDNKEVQRSVTITVNDKIVDELKKEG